MPEALDLGRDHRQVRVLGLFLGVSGHRRDHARHHVEELLLEVHQVAVDRDPALGVME